MAALDCFTVGKNPKKATKLNREKIEKIGLEKITGGFTE
jgi:hypothetical protein